MIFELKGNFSAGDFWFYLFIWLKAFFAVAKITSEIRAVVKFSTFPLAMLFALLSTLRVAFLLSGDEGCWKLSSEKTNILIAIDI